MKKNPRDVEQTLQQLKDAAEHFHWAGGHDHEYGQEELALAKAIKVMERYNVNPPPSRWQLFLQGITKPFVNAWRRFYPLPLEEVQVPPAGYKSWADVPKRLRYANPLQGTANPITFKDGEGRTYASNVAVSLTGDKRVVFLGGETGIKMVTPEKFGLTPRQAQAVRDGKGYDWGKDSDKNIRAARAANVQLSTLVGVIRQNPPKTQEEAQTLIKLLEGSMGKSAETFLAEAATAKAKADEAKNEGVNEAVRDALQVIIENPELQGALSAYSATTDKGERVLQDLQTMVASLKQGGV